MIPKFEIPGNLDFVRENSNFSFYAVPFIVITPVSMRKKPDGNPACHHAPLDLDHIAPLDWSKNSLRPLDQSPAVEP
jgi:hypothetical protein